jgi:hypothetical protein
MTPRILIVTPLLRSYGRAITAAHRLVRRAPCPVEWMLLSEQPHAGYDYRNVLHANNRARTAMLAGDYSHLLMLEDDMVPPPEALGLLLGCEAPVAYGLYCWRRGGRHLWSAYRAGQSLSQADPVGAAVAFAAGAVRETHGVGFGVALIRRDVLEAVPFRLPDDYDRGGACTDWMFSLDCAERGVAQISHFGVVCGHIAMEPSARVIWPALDSDGRPAHRYEYFEVPA